MKEASGLGDVVVSPHHLATDAGIEAFAAGGSAVDAAIATNAVLGVAAPETCGIGGDLFAVVWEEGGGAPATLNASGPAGSGADPSELVHRTRVPFDHPLAVTVPGCVAGWEALHHRFGRLPLDRVLRPAIRLAESGFPVSRELARVLSAEMETLASQPSGAELYPDGAPPDEGEELPRPRLAKTLAAIAGGGAKAYYQGPAAVDISAAVGGRITLDDLAGYRPEWVEPARLQVLGLTGWTVPPNSQGYLTLAAVRVFELAAPPGGDRHPAWLHLMIEAYRAVAWERDDVVADPRSSPSWTKLLDPDRLAARAERIHQDRAARWPAAPPAAGGTAYMCVLGADGLGVSLIQSNFTDIGSGIGAGESGFFLHSRGAGFDLRPGHPNGLAPGKRPLHTLSPTVWSSGGRLAALLGTRGAHRQPQILLQMALRLFGQGWSPKQAQQAPRWAIDDLGGSTVKVEARLAPEAVAALEERGHQVEVGAAWEGGWGPVSVITVGPDGRREAAADPRVDTASAAAR